jgi:glycosyltransferase involved in cell wall biosynthesis
VTEFRPRDRGHGDAVEVLTVAALSRRKGHEFLIRALAELDGAPVRLTLAGDGPERARLERLAAELGVSGAVAFEGAVAYDRVPALYDRADVFCLPSFAEGLPTVLMEAMAAGLPTVATNVNGTAELVDDGVTGILVPPARADLIAAALGRLAADADLRASMGAAGRRRVCEEYELHAAVANLRAVIEPVVRG